MSQFVLDCSVAAAWFLPDEFNEYADRVLECLVTKSAIVPRLWYCEIGNVVCINERRKRLTTLQAEQILYQIGSLPVEIDLQEVDVAFQEVCRISRLCELSVYDAVYLELSQRMSLPLATLDKRLKDAAQSLGCAIFEPEQNSSL